MGNSGGAATNSGIDFQQRIAALVVAQVIAEVKDFFTLQIGDAVNVKELRFETNDSIDDLVIVTNQGCSYIQAKRSLSLSEKIDSEYSSVLRQFVSQYVGNGAEDDYYVLATSPRASKRITSELRKLTEAARLNETGSASNPLTQAEREVFEKTKSLIQAHYLEKTKSQITDEEFEALFKKIRIANLDIEEGAPLETAILTLLSSKSSVSPELVWGSIISLCVSLAKDRLSIDKEGLTKKLGRFIGNQKQETASEIASEYFELKCQNTLSAGRDVLLVKSFVDDADYLIVELYRFNDDGSKRLKYHDKKAELLNGDTWDVISRASTYAGIERFIEENSEKYSNSRLGILPINSNTSPENESFAKAHAQYCASLAEAAEEPLICLHCGDPVSEDSSPFIEVDDNHHDHAVGLVHKRCLRPIDRVIGIISNDLFKKNKLLQNFDYVKWFIEAPRGQGLFNATASFRNRVAPIAWKPDYNRISRGPWCVKINLEDGSARYVHERGRVVRYSEIDAHTTSDYFNATFEESRVKKDPWCYTSANEGFGIYSAALQIMTDEEIPIFCVNAEAARYTKSIGNTYSKFDNFYAPLAILLEEESGLPISIDKTLILVSNPLRLNRFIENWGKAGIELSKFVVSIIESDNEFDKFVRNAKEDKKNILIDPVLNLSGELASGFIVENYYDIVGHEPDNL